MSGFYLLLRSAQPAVYASFFAADTKLSVASLEVASCWWFFHGPKLRAIDLHLPAVCWSYFHNLITDQAPCLWGYKSEHIQSKTIWVRFFRLGRFSLLNLPTKVHISWGICQPNKRLLDTLIPAFPHSDLDLPSAMLRCVADHESLQLKRPPISEHSSNRCNLRFFFNRLLLDDFDQIDSVLDSDATNCLHLLHLDRAFGVLAQRY